MNEPVYKGASHVHFWQGSEAASRADSKHSEGRLGPFTVEMAEPSQVRSSYHGMSPPPPPADGKSGPESKSMTVAKQRTHAALAQSLDAHHPFVRHVHRNIASLIEAAAHGEKSPSSGKNAPKGWREQLATLGWRPPQLKYAGAAGATFEQQFACVTHALGKAWERFGAAAPQLVEAVAMAYGQEAQARLGDDFPKRLDAWVAAIDFKGMAGEGGGRRAGAAYACIVAGLLQSLPAQAADGHGVRSDAARWRAEFVRGFIEQFRHQQDGKDWIALMGASIARLPLQALMDVGNALSGWQAGGLEKDILEDWYPRIETTRRKEGLGHFIIGVTFSASGEPATAEQLATALTLFEATEGDPGYRVSTLPGFDRPVKQEIAGLVHASRARTLQMTLAELEL